MTTDAAFAAVLSDSAPTVLREVRPPQAPWTGALVTDEDGLGVLVDADVVAASFGYWDDPDGHVAVPREVLLVADRARVVMPACTLSLAALLRRWEDDPPPLGELVTAAISVIRGAAQDRGDALAGSWWLRDDGRPIFAPGSDTTPLAEASAAALSAMSAIAGSDQASSLLREIAQEVNGAAPATLRTEQWEDAVFALAPASAISTTARAPGEAIRATASPGTRAARRTDSTRSGSRAPHRRVGRAATVMQRVSARVRSIVPRGRRGRGVLIAAAGAVVLVAGMMWPADSPGESAPPTIASSDGATASAPAASPATLPTPDEGVDIVRALLRGVRECREAACRAGFWEAAEAAPPSDLPDPDHADLELVDDLGGVIVVRTRPPDGTAAHLLVIVQLDDGGWRLRDARTLAPTP